MEEPTDLELPEWLKELQNPQFRDEELAPEVDRELLRALVRRELARNAARQTYALIYSFRSWYDAYKDVTIEEWYHRRATHPEEFADMDD